MRTETAAAHIWPEPAGRCTIIAEIGQSHDGSLGSAHAFVDAVAAAGADAIKFQTHLAAAESSASEPWRVKFSRQDATRYDYWRRTEFTEEQWAGLAQHARDRGIAFISSAFSIEAVELLERVGVPAWKVGAGEITNLPMIERMARTGKPVLLSSGMSGWADLDLAVGVVRRQGTLPGIFQCTSIYPCPPERIGLNVISEIRKRYRCQTGLSDHSGTVFAGLAAATLGIDMLEVHVCFSRECFGPDVSSSITTAELAQLVSGVRFIERAVEHPVDKERVAADLAEMRMIFGKSLVVAQDLPAGHSLSVADLVLRKPGTGIPASRMGEVVNRKLKHPLRAGVVLSEGDFELAPS
jgi:N-acetylneuraminate synthase